METIAFYRETIIKTYGFVEKTNLRMMSFEVSQSGIQAWGEGMEGLISALGAAFLLLIARPIGAFTLRIHLILEELNPEPLLESRIQSLCGYSPETFQAIKAVELLFFHGPHFGDRYGIAFAALEVLEEQGLSVLAMACTAASVFLVFPEGTLSQAREALGRAFFTPEVQRRGEQG